MQKIYISQPMNNIEWQEVLDTRQKIIDRIHQSLGNDVEILNNIFEDYDASIALKYQIKASWLIAEANIVYFAKGWDKSRGCLIEDRFAKAYNKQTVYEN